MKTLILLLWLLLPSTLAAAVVHTNNAQNTGDGGGVTSASFSLAVTAGNPLITCGVLNNNAVVPDTVTFNSVAMTMVTSVNAGAAENLSLWRLAGQSGTATVQADFSTSVSVSIGCDAFTGADQTTPVGTASTGTDWTSPVSITAPANGLAYNVVGSRIDVSCTALTAGDGQTKHVDVCLDVSPEYFYVGSGSRSTSGAMGWTMLNGGYYFQIGVPLNASADVAVRRRIINP